jgi:hypothetical protein
MVPIEISSDGFTLQIARFADGSGLTGEGHVIARRLAKMEMLLRKGCGCDDRHVSATLSACGDTMRACILSTRIVPYVISVWRMSAGF